MIANHRGNGSAHEVLGQRRTDFRQMGRRTKGWIKGMRVVQLGLRVLELNGAIGILVLMILINNVEPLTAWVMRITVRTSPNAREIEKETKT